MPTTEPAKRLFLFDGMALVYRAHFALVCSPRYTSAGVCTSAVFGLANTLLEILDREQPTHLAVVFDTDDPTHRHEAFAEYKGTRQSIPEDLAAQLPLTERLFEAFRIPIVRVPGYEADDVIGTLAGQAEAQGFLTWMVTPDKDFHQLVTEHIRVFKPGRQGGTHEVLGVPEVLARWQIERVEQVIDILGLMGDTSDNIPGVPGIGEKTAQKLIAQYGSIENLLAHTGELKGKQRQSLEEHAEQARLSKHLATIVRDAPHGAELESLAAAKFDAAALKALFAELEFETLGKRLFGPNFSAGAARAAAAQQQRETEIRGETLAAAGAAKTLADVPHQYHTVRTPEERAALIAMLLTQPAISFDTETTGLNPRSATPLGIAFAFAPHEAYYVVCPADPAEAQGVLEEFRPVFEAESIEKIGHNLKYDATLLRWHGVELRGRLFDTLLAHSLKEPEMRHGLDYLAKLYLDYAPIPIEELIGPRGEEQKPLRDVPLERLAEYACEDADVALQVSQVIRPDIVARGVSQVCDDVECPLIPVLVDMEYEGIRLDAAALARYSVQLEQEIAQLQARIYEAAGHEFNIDSPKQLGVVLYDELALVDRPAKTATGQYTTRETELARLAGQHAIVRDVLDYRNAVKLKSVYVDQLPGCVNPQTGRVHTHYSQVWAATGRMQSTNPNLQTIPVRKERGREIRAAFVPRDENYLLLAADYSQIELRIMAELSGDASLREAFTSGQDIHTFTAASVYKVPPAEVTREMRDKAKAVNFGIIYGISAFGLQQRLNIPREEARGLIEAYFAKYGRVREYIDRTIEEARAEGYVKTLTGRRRYLRDINSRNHTLRSAAERLAMNSPIQGTAADLLKLAMIAVHRALRVGGFRTKMLLTVHDEIVFDLHRDEQAAVLPLVEERMRTALPMETPIVVELGVGENWLEAH
ncbi:MAG: DNA polymerase I [Pirellulales bacterium]